MSYRHLIYFFLNLLNMNILSFYIFLLISWGPQTFAATTPSAVKNPGDKVSATAPSTAQEHYLQGVSHYQKANWSEAQNQLQKALQLSPNNPYILYNLGLSAFQLKDFGLAIGAWRRALNLSPGLRPAQQALQRALTQTGQNLSSPSLSTWERFRELFLVPFRSLAFNLFTLIFFAGAGWLGLTYIGRRKEALAANTPLPRFPYGATVCGLFFAMFCTLMLLKWYDLSQPRGTVTAARTKALSAPEVEAAELFDLSLGTEVVLNQTATDWVQVSFPGGLTGWVKQSDVFQTLGEPLW